MALESITISPSSGQPPQGLIVLLHGWGANRQDLLALAPFINLPEYQLVFAEAPFPHPYNPVGKMWYAFPEEYRFMGQPEFRDRPDLVASRQQLIELLQSLAKETGIPPSRTILGGFSQGGAMTLDVGLQLPLAGLMVLSGYLHAPIPPEVTSCPPTLIVHGLMDTVVPIRSAHQVRESLKSLNGSVRYLEFEMGHEIQPLVLDQIRKFVKEILPND